MSKGILASALAAIVLAAIVVGCGGGDDSTGGGGGDETAAALSKAEFIKKADAICAKGNQSIGVEAEEFAKENNVNTNKPTEAQQEEVIVEVVAPGIRKQGDEIAELGAPSGDEEQVEAIVDAVETGADELEDAPKELIEGNSPLVEGSKLAKAYGLKECGEE